MKMRAQLLLGYIIIFVLIIFITFTSYQSLQDTRETHLSTLKTQEVITSARMIEKLIVDMQTGKRGFIITGEEDYLQPYETARAAYEIEFGNLKNLISGNQRQVERLDEVNSIVKSWLKIVVEPQIEERRDIEKSNASLNRILDRIQEEGVGRTIVKDVRDKLTVFIDYENSVRDEKESESTQAAARSTWIIVIGALSAILIGILTMLVVIRNIQRQVGGEPVDIANIANEIAQGNLDLALQSEPQSSTGILGSVITMTEYLRKNRLQTERQDWLKSGLVRLGEVIREDPDIDNLSSKVISEITSYLGGQIGALYIAQEKDDLILSLRGSYAFTKRKNLSSEFKTGEGLVGQAALEKQQILLKNAPEDYIKVSSALGEHVPCYICVTPFSYEGRIKGVIEIGTLGELTDQQLEYLEQASEALAVAVENAQGRTRLAKALQESQQLSEELQVQHEELKTLNEELESQTQRLKESEEELKAQQEELEVTNEELEEKNELLEQQKRAVEKARSDIEEKAAELAIASKYKSEFLANMSHELRTPLNSLLLLAQSLAENKEGNLSQPQLESAEIIYGAGSDLLNLINEILDLSKIEAGRMDLRTGKVPINDLVESTQAAFNHMAAKKGLDFEVKASPDAPERIVNDRKRIEQVIRNLVGNAIKFTESGKITVTFGRPAEGAVLSRSGLSTSECLSISIKDTGIGIDKDKHKVIFEAFQQAEGGTSRRYGGTGLGLSISRELANLLGGEIQVDSEKGKGSTFTLYLPLSLSPRLKDNKRPLSLKEARPATIGHPLEPAALRNQVQIDDDRENIEDNDKLILVVEDDPKFAGLMLNKCHDKGFKCLAASTGEMGLELARKHIPGAVILDLRLPGIDGWAVLGELKEDVNTRHIPVHIISVEEPTTESFRKGAIGHAAKPINQETLEAAFLKIENMSAGKPRRLLIIEDDEKFRRETVKLLASKDVIVDEAASAAQAIEAMHSSHYDCIVLDLRLPDMDGLKLIETLEKEGIELPPIVVYTAKDLTVDEEELLREYTDSIIIKDVRSQERLLDEVSLFLHRVVSTMPEKKKKIILNLHDTDSLLRGKKVLIVDDDMRTTFALSKLLSDRGMETLKAENGKAALEMLNKTPDVNLVLMDIMMPVMDGFEAIKNIREQDRFRSLPIIALTAKAMKEDRIKCLESGASDYMTKPVEQGRLISMLRVWLYR